MIIVYAGSQPDAEDRATPRFPQATEEQVALRIRGLLQDLKPSLVIGALAAGSDILFAESARQENVPLRTVLPFEVGEFRESSVTPAGARWEERYDRLTSEIEVLTGELEITETAYTDHNAVVLDHAARVAEQTGEEVWCLLVRPNPDADTASSVTDDMAERAAGRGILVLDMNPLAMRKRAFVVMPFGRKFDPFLRREIDCDQVFKRIYRPLLEDLDLDWNRADLEVDSGIIHVGMIDDLANSEVVLADLTTTNFNVAYEIGVRHVFARRSTVLVSPTISGQKSSAPPFDVSMIRAHSFERGLKLSDAQAQNAIRQLRPIIEAAVRGSLHADSPIHEWFNVDVIIPPFSRRSDLTAVDEEIEIRKRIRTALKSAAAEPMLAAADILITADISEQARLALRLELAVGLLDESRYEDALSLLELAEPAMENPLHRVWLHKSVLALRRIGERTSDSVARKQKLDRAEELLRLALEFGYTDSESYGIWGGLLKRRLMHGELQGLAATATFQLMTEYYELGFRADPQAYTGVNYAMALRVQGNRRDLSEGEREKLTEALVVGRFLNDISTDRDATDPWVLFTDAELQLHKALANGTDTTEAALAYATAALSASTEVRNSALDQLRFMRLWGDPGEVIDPIIDVISAENPRHD
ncbi:tetratricopeptide repeat-containing protein [Arthrobacter sp. H16F315]|uniref:tetratricopeptide repeat-containing protein n=1 Tax=Arthrobacter sp. H16F315 TaxID=2955314 RepID=UPI002096DF73|nr:tetratricopeptide repeat-containing protein [Arthrobacter sp. H16F315]MDD1475475.1 hypothetical protein [Arthrobacter sp. H16F315]